MKKNSINKKTYAQKISQEKRKKIKELIDWAVEHHEKFKNAYFWAPPSNAGQRKNYEKVNSGGVKFTYNGKEYEYDCKISCSCQNIYYYHDFLIDGEKKTVREFHKVLAELDAAIEAYEEKHCHVS